MSTSYNLTGDLSDLLGSTSVAATARGRLETNLPPTDALVDTTGQTVLLGTLSVPIDPDGTFSLTGLVGSDSTDLNIEAGELQYQLVVNYNDPGVAGGGRRGSSERTWRSGWFFLNQDEDIATVAKAASPNVVSTGAEIIAAASAEADRAEAAAEAAVAPTDTMVASLAADPQSETGQALSATIEAASGIAGRVSDLPSPFYISHRGGPLLAGEESMTAYRIAVAMGSDAIEQDVRTLADGTAAVMHDATVDRTTTGTGDVSTFNALTWQRLQIDTAGLIGGTGWPVEYAPLFETIVREFGNKTTLAPQAYDSGALAGIDAVVERFNVSKATILLQCSSPDVAGAARDRGFPYVLVVSNDTSPTFDFAPYVAAGVSFFGVPHENVTGAYVDAAHAAGIKVVPYSVQSRSQRDALLALGVDGFFTDDAGYVKETVTPTKGDLFALQAPTSGFHYISGSAAGTFEAPDIFAWTGSTTGARRLGYLTPTDPTSYTLTAEIMVSDKGLTNAAGHLSLASEDFSVYSTDRPNTIDGYLFHFRTDGLYRVEEQVNASRSNGGGWPAYNVPIPGFAFDVWVKVAITLAPTGLSVSINDGAAASYNATTLGGSALPHICISTYGATKFRNITIT